MRVLAEFTHSRTRPARMRPRSTRRGCLDHDLDVALNRRRHIIERKDVAHVFAKAR